MIAKIIPALKLPRQTAGFDYLVEDGLAIGRGSLVFIPWRGRTVLGVVQRLVPFSDLPPSRLKSISGLALPGRMSEDWLAAMEWAADRYLTPLGTVAKCFLPTPPKRLKPLPHDIAVALGENPAVAGTAAEQLHFSGNRGRIRLFGSPEEKWRILGEAVNRCQETGQSLIVLAPHQEDIRDAAARLRERHPDRTAEIHGQLAAGKLWREWEAAYSGRATIVVGSRMAVMAPVRRLGLIVVLEADSPDHKQYDQNPRYDARTLARIRTETGGAELLILTQSPRTEDLSLIRNGFRLEDASSEPADVVLADISAWGQDWSGPLAPASLERIRQSLQNGKNALIYHNRLGTAGALACADCRFVIRCLACSLAMSVHQQQLHCHRCGQTDRMPEACPACGGPRLRLIGWGTAAVEEFLKKSVPGVAVSRYDQETGRPMKPVLPAAGVVIGSRGLVHDLAERFGGDFQAVIVTAAEDLLRHPGFRTMEEAWGLVRKLRYLAAQGGSGGEVILQTLTPDDARVRGLTRDVQPFLSDELEARTAAGYPPAGRLILIIARGADEAAARKSILVARQRLEAACRGNGHGTVLSPPFRPSQPISHGQWRQALAIKTPLIKEGLMQALRLLPDEYLIDTDPETPI